MRRTSAVYLDIQYQQTVLVTPVYLDIQYQQTARHTSLPRYNYSTNKQKECASVFVTRTQHRPESLTVTLTWHASKWKVHTLRQRYTESLLLCSREVFRLFINPLTAAAGKFSRLKSAYIQACKQHPITTLLLMQTVHFGRRHFTCSCKEWEKPELFQIWHFFRVKGLIPPHPHPFFFLLKRSMYPSVSNWWYMFQAKLLFMEQQAIILINLRCGKIFVAPCELINLHDEREGHCTELNYTAPVLISRAHIDPKRKRGTVETSWSRHRLHWRIDTRNWIQRNAAELFLNMKGDSSVHYMDITCEYYLNRSWL